MKTTYHVALLSMALTLMIGSLSRGESPEGRWTQFDEEDGIKLWRLDVPGRDLPGFRGETVIPGPVSAIVAQLKRVDRHTEWMHRCSASETLQRYNDDRVVIYNRTDIPWPVWDRDVILDTLFTYASEGRLVTLTFKTYDPTLRPLPEHVVRMPRLEGFYRMWQFSPERTKVVYQVEADVGGSVPKWMAERVARDMPYETLSRLRERVARGAPPPEPLPKGEGERS